MQPLPPPKRLKAPLMPLKLLNKLPTAQPKLLRTLKPLLKKQPMPLKKQQTLRMKPNRLNQPLAKPLLRKRLPSSLLLSKVA